MTNRRKAFAVGTLGAWIVGSGAFVLIHCGNSGDSTGTTCQGSSCANASSGASGSNAGDEGAGGSGSGTPSTTSGQDNGSGNSGSGAASGTGVADGGSPGVDASPPISSDGGGAGCGASTWPASGTFTIDVSGKPREYIVTLPTNYASSKPYKLIFAWHGLGGSAAQVAGTGGGFGASYAYYGLQAMASNTVIFVSGQGLDPNDSGAGWPNTNDQDIAFTRAMLQWLQSKYCIDDKHIFSVGMSYGGIMSDTVGCEMGDVVRAVTPMSGSGPYSFRGSKPCVGEVAVWMSHGNQDTTVPFEAGVASRNHWVAANHCGSDTKAVGPGTCVEYQGCDTGYPVDWCEFDGGHTIPSFATQGIWSFLSRF